MSYANGKEETLMDQVQQADVIRLDLPAADKYLNVVGSCLEAVLERLEGVSERKAVTSNVVLAVHEACANIVEHAYGGVPGRIELAIFVYDSPRRIVVDTHDTGSAFDLEKVEPPDLDKIEEGGIGIYLIRSLMDEVVYAPQSGSNHWRLVKNL